MEVKINKEIREYTEGIFLGLSLRQCLFSFLACVMAVIFYFLFIDLFQQIWCALKMDNGSRDQH